MFNFLVSHSPLLYLTQSVWRDEAFSILAAQQPLSKLFGTFGFEPPFYYVLLHFWLKIFGTGEIATRSLSFLGLILGAILLIIWSEKLFSSKKLPVITTLMFVFNPMLIYYGFEIRTYGWFIFFTIAAFYTFWEKKWFWYAVASTLGFYNHTYFIFIPAAQFLYWLFIDRKARRGFLRSFLVFSALISPWIIKILLEIPRLQQSWYFPVDWQLIKSVLGNLYLGYEGTPGGYWQHTAWLSLGMLTAAIYSLTDKVNRHRNLYFLSFIFFPLVFVIGFSFIKPVFVNRYLIFVTVSEVILLSCVIEAMKNKLAKIIFVLVNLLFITCFNFWYPAKHAKLDIRQTMTQVNNLKKQEDLVYVESPLILFESVYYSRNPKQVFWYNPNNVGFPWYIGEAIFSPRYVTRDLPVFPQKAYLIRENGSFEVIYRMPVNHL